MVRRRGDDSQSDRALIGTRNKGDAVEAAQAFDALYRRHKDFVLRVATRFVPDTDSALDVLQETFLYLLARFPPTGTGVDLTAKLTTLLYPVAKNIALTAQRRTRRFPAAAVAPDELPAPAAADATSSGDLSALFATLPIGQREVLLLRFVDDLSLAEIAQTLDIPLGTVKSRLHLGIATLKSRGAADDLRD